MNLFRYAWQEWTDAFLRPGDAWAVICLFAVAVSAFPLALPASDVFSPRLSVAVLWTSLLFASVLSVRGIFDDDLRSGRAEQYVMLASSFFMVTAIKIIAHWLRHFVPAALAAPVLFVIAGGQGSPLSLSLSTLAAGASCSALCTATAALLPPNKGALAATLLLPLYIPLIIFGAEASRGNDQATAALLGCALTLFPVSAALAAYAVKARLQE